MKKIEELTLYIIDQDKTLQETRRQLNEEHKTLKAQQERLDRVEGLLKSR